MLTKSDFYQGAIISNIINSNKNINISLFNEEESKKIIKIKANENEYKVITKYDAKLPKKVKNGYKWAFTYSMEDVQKLISFENEKLYFAFLCQKDGLAESRVAILDMIQLKECLLPKEEELKENIIYNIKIYSELNTNYFKVYGSGLSPGTNSAENGVRIEWNRISIFK